MYEMYSQYYDQLNDHDEYWIPFIKKLFPEKNASIIEFGCGTGKLLTHFKDEYRITGVDISEAMLKIAKEKLPSAEFLLGDMSKFQSEHKFDVILCLFDSLNHILEFQDWIKFFEVASKLISNKGKFIFDINTTGRLKKNSQRPPIIKEFETNYFYMNLIQKDEKNFVFDVRVLQNIGDGLFREYKEKIEETTETGEIVLETLKNRFLNIEIYNEKQEKIGHEQIEENNTHRLFFVCSGVNAI